MEKVVAVVLIVEDEALIPLNAMDFATDAGHEAIEAANADDAIRLLESRNDIDIVFSDVSMPGSMDGLRLIQLIRNRWPPIRLILTSAKALAVDAELPMGTVFLPKPYGFQTLSSILNH